MAKISEDIHFYTTGACDSFALAMAKRFGLTIRCLFPVGENAVLHAWLLTRSGTPFDARGMIDEREMVREYSGGVETRIVSLVASELEALIGEGEWEEEAAEDIQRHLSYYLPFVGEV